MQDVVARLWPEIQWIEDKKLRSQVTQTWVKALERSPLKPDDLLELWTDLLADRMDLRVVSSAHQPKRLAASPIGGNALVGHPHALREFSGLPEHVDRHSATWIPVAPDAQPFRLEQRKQPPADRDRTVFVECAVIAEAIEVELQRFRFDKEASGYVIDDQMGKIGLPGDRT